MSENYLFLRGYVY